MDEQLRIAQELEAALRFFEHPASCPPAALQQEGTTEAQQGPEAFWMQVAAVSAAWQPWQQPADEQQAWTKLAGRLGF